MEAAEETFSKSFTHIDAVQVGKHLYIFEATPSDQIAIASPGNSRK